MADITISEEAIQAIVDKAVDAAIEKADKLRRVDVSKRQPTTTPRRKSTAGKGPFNIRSFNPTTKEMGSINDREWLWNPSKITRCPCGEVEFAQTQEYLGTFHIEEAMTPTILRDGNGQIVDARDPWMPLDSMPEHLERTEEKVAHFKECYDKSIEGIV